MSPPSSPNRRGLVAALAVVALLVLAGLWLSQRLGNAGSLQDCLASGRTNCAPISPAPP